MKIHKFIFKIILNDQAFMLCGIADQLQSPGNRHDFAPFCHVGRRNINNSAVLVTVSDLETKIREYGAALNKRGSGKGNGFFVPDQRAENLQKALDSRANYNIIR